MEGHISSANCVEMQSKQSVSTCISRRAGLVAVLITLAVFLLPTAGVHAQLSPQAQIIVDFLGLDENFEGRIEEHNGVLWIGGDIITTVNGTEKRQAIEYRYVLGTRTFASQALEPPGNPNASGSGTNVNSDGSCVVGYQDSGFFTPFHAFRWTQATGPVDLGTLDPANSATRSSFATGTSQDCSVVVGISDIADGITQHAFRWTPGSMIDLGVPANGGPVSRGLGTIADGTVVVGDADFPDPNNLISGKSRKAFRWTQAGGFQSLGDLQPAGISIATAVTADATTVVGQATTNSGSAAFRWTAQNPVMQPIGPLPGHARAAATAVSDNGKIVVGMSHLTFLQYQGPVLGWGQGTAFRWTQATGIKELRQVLIDAGVDMTGITLVSATGISPDGQWIVGSAKTSQTGPNETVPFIVQVCDDAIGGPCSTTGATTGTTPFSLGAAPNQLTVSAGQSGSTTITTTPDAGFSQPVSFSCSGLPAGATCTFNPVIVTPNGGPVNTTLTIATDGGLVAMLAPRSSPTMVVYALTPFALMLIGGLLYRRRMDFQSLCTGLLLVLMVAMASCSGSDSAPPSAGGSGGGIFTGTPAGTSTVTVTATSGASNATVQITLTVTRP